MQEFTSKLESYREISKSLGENSSELEHAIATIKHFILHLEPKNVENYFMRIDDKISSVTDNLSDLSNYVTILDSVQKTVNSTNTIISSKVSSTDGDSVSLGQLDIKLQKLESICSQLTTEFGAFQILSSRSDWNPKPICLSCFSEPRDVLIDHLGI